MPVCFIWQIQKIVLFQVYFLNSFSITSKSSAWWPATHTIIYVWVKYNILFSATFHNGISHFCRGFKMLQASRQHLPFPVQSLWGLLHINAEVRGDRESNEDPIFLGHKKVMKWGARCIIPTVCHNQFAAFQGELTSQEIPAIPRTLHSLHSHIRRV